MGEQTSGEVLDSLYQVIDSKRQDDPEKSYTAQLLAAAPEKPARKLCEEATETLIEALRGDAEALAQESADLLQELGVRHVVVVGDTRFDRVVSIAEQAVSQPLIERFIQQDKVWVMGSIWPADIDILQPFILKESSKHTQFILAPHNTSCDSIDYFKKCFPEALCYSQILENTDLKEVSILILDSVGLLSTIYKYATYAYIGGAFGAGLHNTIEAAVYGIPIFFGRSPKNLKFKECQDLIVEGAAFEFSNLL